MPQVPISGEVVKPRPRGHLRIPPDDAVQATLPAIPQSRGLEWESGERASGGMPVVP